MKNAHAYMKVGDFEFSVRWDWNDRAVPNQLETIKDIIDCYIQAVQRHQGTLLTYEIVEGVYFWEQRGLEDRTPLIL